MASERQAYAARIPKFLHLSRPAEDMTRNNYHSASGFLNALVRFGDGSAWGTTRKMSHIKYQ
jgi:hypothetical protein